MMCTKCKNGIQGASRIKKLIGHSLFITRDSDFTDLKMQKSNKQNTSLDKSTEISFHMEDNVDKLKDIEVAITRHVSRKPKYESDDKRKKVIKKSRSEGTIGAAIAPKENISRGAIKNMGSIQSKFSDEITLAKQRRSRESRAPHILPNNFEPNSYSNTSNVMKDKQENVFISNSVLYVPPKVAELKAALETKLNSYCLCASQFFTGNQKCKCKKICYICKKHFKGHNYLTDHQINCHRGELDSSKCNFCYAILTSVPELIFHIATEHKDEFAG